MTSQVEKEHRTNNSDTAVTPRLYHQWYSRRAGIGRWLNSERRRIARWRRRKVITTARRAPQNSNGREQFVPLGETVLDCRCASLKQRQQTVRSLMVICIMYMYRTSNCHHSALYYPMSRNRLTCYISPFSFSFYVFEKSCLQYTLV